MARRATIFIARHGERLDFVDRSWRITATHPDDAPLTPRGERQAMDLGRHLSSSGISTIISSPFQRCVRTASIVASQLVTTNMKIAIEPGVCEWLNQHWYSQTANGPIWKPLDILSREAAMFHGVCRIDNSYHAIRQHSFNFDAYPEQRHVFMTRCREVAAELRRRADRSGGNMLIVGHGSTVDGLIRSLVPGTKVNRITCTFHIHPSTHTHTRTHATISLTEL